MYLKITSPKLAKNVRRFYPRESDIGWMIVFLAALILIATYGLDAFSQVALPGSDESSRLEAAGTLLRIIDTGLFQWGTRIFAGLSIVSAGWALKEQRFGVAIMCIISAQLGKKRVRHRQQRQYFFSASYYSAACERTQCIAMTGSSKPMASGFRKRLMNPS